VVVFVVGAAGTGLGSDRRAVLRPGDTIGVGGYEVTLVGLEPATGTDHTGVRAAVAITDGGGTPFVLHPELRAYEGQPRATSEAALRSNALDDVQVALSWVETDLSAASMNVYVRPLQVWVWVGGALTLVAGGAALLARSHGQPETPDAAHAATSPRIAASSARAGSGPAEPASSARTPSVSVWRTRAR
jgi:cytochrome c-type biogenesis protein CcmF